MVWQGKGVEEEQKEWVLEENKSMDGKREKVMVIQCQCEVGGGQNIKMVTEQMVR